MGSMEEVMLFVKAGDDGKRNGACPFCQRIFMVLLVKASELQVQFQVATVNLAKPPEAFRKFTLRRVPALVHGQTALDNVDEIVQYLDDHFPTDFLRYFSVQAEASCNDLFQKFCFYIKDVAKDASKLETELAIIDAYLRQCEAKFLCTDYITHIDCEILPKLHHVRVACKALKGYDIPTKFEHLWTYLRHGYEDEVFTKTCPSDQEIVVHWAEKPETPNLSMEERARMAREVPKYSFDVPVRLE